MDPYKPLFRIITPLSLSEPETPVIVHFSTVIHERGSPETLTDPRGFAVKFYTRECMIEKENNFKQPGERYRSWASDRQERFICRWVEGLSDPGVTHEIRSIWISYWSQADKSLGQKIASRLNIRPTM